MPTVYGGREIPGYFKPEDEALDYTRSVPREYKSMVWLMLSSKVNIHIDGDCKIKSRNEETIDCSWLPYTRIY